MLYVNNELLTSERIIDWFEKNLESLCQIPIEGSQKPSRLSELKSKLKANFFAEFTGCNLILQSVPPGEIDVNPIPREKTPFLLKQGNDYLVYGPSGKSGQQWTLTSLDRHIVEQANLDFSSEILLSYSPQYQFLYAHIASKNNQIPLQKKPLDQDMPAILASDNRFQSEYPKLKQVLNQIFALKDTDDKKQALAQLKAIPGTDWDTEKAMTQLAHLNDKYGYFEHFPDSLKALFIELAIACRTQIVLFEKNNPSKDTRACNYAYKLMALYVDPKHPEQVNFDNLATYIYKLMSNIDSDKDHPFHQALLVKLADMPHAREVTDRTGWRTLVIKEGIKAFPFFLTAKKIEDKIAEQTQFSPRAPKDLREAKEMAMLCCYTRAAEDPTFAALCHDNKVDEERFNACLDYLAQLPGWPKKSSDAIPDITVKGEGAATGLYWVKLPVTDKRALILGDITDCCQSIAGDSEQCVKDAVSLNDNGLYVLVKQRKSQGNPALIIDGELNEREFKIVGQSYIWNSKNGNICLDSIECLQGEVSVDAMKSILSDFASRVLEEKPGINYVTLGQGGKTPERLFADALIAEQKRQGNEYEDSTRQYCIKKRPSGLSKEQLIALAKYPLNFSHHIEYLCTYLADTADLVNKLQEIVEQNPLWLGMFSVRQLNNFLYFTQAPSLEDLKPVNWDNPSSSSSVDQLMWQAATTDEILKTLNFIPLEDRLAFVKAKIQQGHPLLHQTARTPESLKDILTLYPEPERLAAVNLEDVHGDTVLHWAATTPESLKAVLALYPPAERLAAVKKQNACGETALQLAMENPESLRTVLALLPETERLSFVKEKDQHGCTVLYRVVNKPELLKAVLALYPKPERLAAVKEKDQFGNTVLHWAEYNPDSLKALLTLLPEPDRLAAVNVKDRSGDTVLHRIAENPDSLKAILTLLPEPERLAAVSVKDRFGDTVLHLAAENPASHKIILESLPESCLSLLLHDEDLYSNPEYFSVLKDVVLQKKQNADIDSITNALNCIELTQALNVSLQNKMKAELRDIHDDSMPSKKKPRLNG